jgi:4-amino-4-deoxy-L-arabinose transferase-like glycosyltransferase
MTAGVRRIIVLLTVSITVLFFRLGEARLWDRDEPRNARCAIEMLERNDWIVPFFNNELRTHKPVLLYWLMMTAYAVFGQNEFAARFWSAALGVGTVLCTYRIGSKLFSSEAGFWGALCLTPALMFNVAARAATPDSLLIFLIALAMLLFVDFAYSTEQHKFFASREWQPEPSFTLPQMIWFYATLGLAVLAKGPVGFVLPMAIVGFTVFADNYRQRRTDPWITTMLRAAWRSAKQTQLLYGTVVMLLVAVPWYAWVGWRTDGEFLRGFFWEHNVRRATESMENHRGSPLFFYPVTLLIGFFPASIFALPTIGHLLFVWRRKAEHHSAITFCVLWIGMFVGLFSLAGTKLPSYVTPCYPALAVLTGFTVNAWLKQEWNIATWWMNLSQITLGLVGIATVPALLWVTRRYIPGAEGLALLGVILCCGCCLAIVLAVFHQRAWSLGATIGAGLLFSGGLFGMGSVAVDAHQQQHVLFDAIHAHSRHAEVSSWHCLESSWVYYLGSPIHEFPHESNSSGGAVIRQFLADSPDRFVILRERDWKEMEVSLQNEITVVATAPYFLKSERLLLLRSNEAQRLANRP